MVDVLELKEEIFMHINIQLDLDSETNNLLKNDALIDQKQSCTLKSYLCIGS